VLREQHLVELGYDATAIGHHCLCSLDSPFEVAFSILVVETNYSLWRCQSSVGRSLSFQLCLLTRSLRLGNLTCEIIL
jgi:hypothetical protein